MRSLTTSSLAPLTTPDFSRAAFCNLPLTYEEYEWVEKSAPALLPDQSLMTVQEKNLHRIQMLQLALQHIQAIEERQALGVVLEESELLYMNRRGAVSDELSSIKFNLSKHELTEIRNMQSGQLDGREDEGGGDQKATTTVICTSQTTTTTTTTHDYEAASLARAPQANQ